MRAKCVMYGCKNASYNEFGVLLNFHRFPKDPKRHQLWKAICKNPRIANINYKCLFLCSQHFDKSSFVKHHLKATAVPNRNLPNDTASASTQENTRVGTGNATEAVDKVKPERNIEPEEKIKKEVEYFEEIIQEHSSEGDESDSSKLLETSGDDSNDSSKTSKSWHAKNPIINTPRAESPKIAEPIIASVESLAPSTSKVSHEVVDDCSAFAEFLKTRMRKFDHVQKSIAQKLISDIMFMADTRQLQLTTVVLTPQLGPQFVMATVPQGAPPGKVPQGAPPGKLVTSMPAKANQRQNQSTAYVIHDDSDDDSPLAKRKK